MRTWWVFPEPVTYLMYLKNKDNHSLADLDQPLITELINGIKKLTRE